MVEAWDGWCNYAQNKNVKFVLPKEGADLWTDTMVVLKTSKNKEAAMAFINYMLDEGIAGSVTIHSSGKMSRVDLFDLFGTILEVNGLTYSREGDLYRIMPVSGASTRMTIGMIA